MDHSKLTNRPYDLSIMREHEDSKDGGCHGSHGIHVAMSKEEVIIKLDVNNLDVNQNRFTS